MVNQQSCVEPLCGALGMVNQQSCVEPLGMAFNSSQYRE